MLMKYNIVFLQGFKYNSIMWKRYTLICVLAIYSLSGNAYTYEEYMAGKTPINKETQVLFSDYLEAVKSKLAQNWVAPDFVQGGHAKIIFKLDNEGYILSANIAESSKNELFDESAIYALQKSEPFGNFPNNCERKNIVISYSFDTNTVQEDEIANIKRLHAIKRFAEVDNSPFAYYYLANCYERVGDIQNAMQSIDKAISMTELNSQYLRYRAELIKGLK